MDTGDGYVGLHGNWGKETYARLAMVVQRNSGVTAGR
jgi:hypothetical protein